MSQAYADCCWDVLGHSQRGASHVRQALPNQDAIAYRLAEDGSSVVLAVADGHGSAKSFRSDVGAQFAVETAVEVCRDFLQGMRGAEPSAVKNAAKQGIPAKIVREWRRRVKEHVNEKSFIEDELARLTEQAGAAASELAARPEQHYVAYGSTLLVAILTNQFLICFQLGDGDVLAAYDATDEVGRVIAKDEALIANETTSLCQVDPAAQFRYKFQVIQHSPPGLILLSTDGYSNSFASQEAFLKAGADYLGMLRTEGGERIQKDLPAWLEETSQSGSGDDITVGIIYRRKPPLGKPEAAQMASESPGASASSEVLLKGSNALDAAPVSRPAELSDVAGESPVVPNLGSQPANGRGNVTIVATGTLMGATLAFLLLVTARILFQTPLREVAPGSVLTTMRDVGWDILGRGPARGAVVTVWIILFASTVSWRASVRGGDQENFFH